MTKVVISKAKKEKLIGTLFAGIGAIYLRMAMEHNIHISDSDIKLRDKIIGDIKKILDND